MKLKPSPSIELYSKQSVLSYNTASWKGWKGPSRAVDSLSHPSHTRKSKRGNNICMYNTVPTVRSVSTITAIYCGGHLLRRSFTAAAIYCKWFHKLKKKLHHKPRPRVASPCTLRIAAPSQRIGYLASVWSSDWSKLFSRPSAVRVRKCHRAKLTPARSP